MQIHNLFPTAVSTTDLDYTIDNSEFDFINQQEFQDNRHNHRSVDSYLLEKNELSSLRNEINKHVQMYFKEVYQPNDHVSLHITQSWCNKTYPGEMHHKHAHTNSIISGVYYVSANADLDRIWFDKGNVDSLQIEPVNFNSYNATSWYFPVHSGQLVLFPSSLLHYVNVVEKDVRVSLSFNTFVKGSIGSEFLLSELNL
jgi:uncharacterized protein (TIGR02466 family)